MIAPFPMLPDSKFPVVSPGCAFAAFAVGFSLLGGILFVFVTTGAWMMR